VAPASCICGSVFIVINPARSLEGSRLLQSPRMRERHIKEAIGARPALLAAKPAASEEEIRPRSTVLPHLCRQH
jgi:hypothetical protein